MTQVDIPDHRWPNWHTWPKISKLTYLIKDNSSWPTWPKTPKFTYLTKDDPSWHTWPKITQVNIPDQSWRKLTYLTEDDPADPLVVAVLNLSLRPCRENYVYIFLLCQVRIKTRDLEHPIGKWGETRYKYSYI